MGAGEFIAVCPSCTEPTYFDVHGSPTPGALPHQAVDALPSDVERIYDELRRSVAARCPTGAVMLARNLLMYVAVDQGAPTGRPFAEYVDFIRDNLLPPKDSGWVDVIRTVGNEANHEISTPTANDVSKVGAFVEMLLKLVYEFPSRI